MILERLIDAIYSAATQVGGMRAAMRAVGKAVGADSSFLFSSHSPDSPDAILLGVDMAQEQVDRFSGHWCREDIWAIEAGRRQLMRRGTVIIGTELVSEREQFSSRFHNEFGIGASMHRMLGSVIADGAGHGGLPFTNLCWYRGEGEADFNPDEKRLLCQVLPHLERLLSIQFALQARRCGGAALMLKRDGTVLHHDPQAGPMRIVGGKLVQLGEGSSPSVADALRMAASGGRAVDILFRERGGHRLRRAVLSPCTPDQPGYFGAGATPAFALTLYNPPESGPESERALTRLYHLTEAEARVAVALVNGAAPADIARRHQVAISTVRSQIRAVFDKCGVSKHVDLVQTLAALRY